MHLILQGISATEILQNTSFRNFTFLISQSTPFHYEFSTFLLNDSS